MTKATLLPPVGRLHEMAGMQPRCPAATTADRWSTRLGEGLLRNPQVAVVGSVGQAKSRIGVHGGKAALMGWLYLDALRRSDRPVVVFDEACRVEPFDLSVAPHRAIDPLAVAPAPTGPATGRRGW